MASTNPTPTTSTTNVPENANETCVGPDSEQAGKADSCAGCPNQRLCASGKANAEDPAVALIATKLASVKYVKLKSNSQKMLRSMQTHFVVICLLIPHEIRLLRFKS